MLIYSSKNACLEHSNFFTVICATTRITTQCHPHNHAVICRRETGQRSENPRLATQKTAQTSTTSFSTATTLIYAIGAGITAAAGTRLALQWVLVNVFKLYSFQLPDQRPGISMYCHYLPVSGLGNLRACCLPWKW